MRGKAVEMKLAGTVHGITPAYAGKRGRCCPDRLRCWDHPCMCGEKFAGTLTVRHSIGSPPRVRGKELCPICVGGTHGITPACAGKRALLVESGESAQDHPRVCGEKKNADGDWPSCTGSPPRVRGKVRYDPAKYEARGITPACAGKSCRVGPVKSSSWDHPRVCGEKHRDESSGTLSKGSPPRVRGKVRWLSGLSGSPGITPACAGKSLSVVLVGGLAGDHPRVCGEKSLQPADGGLA